jgi:hypothetical protein
VTEETSAPRAPWTSGFRVLIVGGIVLVGLLLYLQPATDVTQCPNYGGNGNASAFPDERWDGYLILGVPVWLLFIGLEQILPVTARGRRGAVVVGRAIIAVMVAVVGSCCGLGPLLILCH